jgi:SNF2 family DNA or RNA helicase
MSDSKGGDLFIVDNSVSGWTGLEYLRQWSEISTAFDIATGFFEIGALLALDGEWQKLKKIRILMGDEVTSRTRRALLAAITEKVTQILDDSVEDAKHENPFLLGVPAIVSAMQSGQIECRIYNKDKFHAKAYITHPRLEVVGSKALVGSSNFTRPGLTQNIELNIQVQSPGEVNELQEWYEEHWEEAVDISEEIVNLISRHLEEWTPFDVYVRALSEYFRAREAHSGFWEENESKMFPVLDQYQKEAYWSMMKIAAQHNGAFLCDGVGLGKTFVGLMIIERLVRDKKHVVLFAPKGAREGVWEPMIKQYLGHIGSQDFSNLAVFSHTDLQREGDFPDRFRRIAAIADAVVIDEAHHFRNQGQLGDPETGEKRSRYYRMFDLMGERPKQVFMLTATPINNRLTDFRHMIELFTRKQEDFFGRTLGIHNLRAHFNALERKLRGQLGDQADNLSENLAEAQELLEKDVIFESLVVQRSRAYATESQKREYGEAAAFPERKRPQVAEYSIRKTYGNLLNMMEKAFSHSTPLFRLSVYYPLQYYIGDDEDIDAFTEARLRMVVSLIRTQFLKRFESSVYAFEMSCDRLLKKLLAFLDTHCEEKSERSRLDRWIAQNEDILSHASQRQRELWDDAEEDEELIPQELLDKAEEDRLSRDEYEVSEIINETFLDLDQLVKFLEETRKFEPEQDDKLKKLLRMLKSKEFVDKKVIVFTEFADTARYLEQQLAKHGIEGLERVDGGTSGKRYDVVKRFAPYYNGMSSSELEENGMDEIRVLIATDVLSEGLNLQDGTRLINYDIHWNPVRLMQRIGRVDRRMNPDVEARLIADHPEQAPDRGKVAYWNFLPPDELNALLTLYNTVTRKTLLISKTMGIEGRRLLTPEDEYEALREFNAGYEGERSLVENMHLDLQELLDSTPGLAEKIAGMPGAIFSGRKRPAKGTHGVFFCFSLPAWDNEVEEFTEAAGTSAWYLYEIDSGEILEEPERIIDSIRCTPSTPRKCQMEQPTLKGIRDKVQKHIKNTYLKRIDAPLGVNASLRCWIEIN